MIILAGFVSASDFGDPIAYYEFNSTELLYEDGSNQSYELSVGGGSPIYTASGMLGGAIDFELSDTDYLINKTMSASNATSVRTVQFWFKPEGWANSDTVLVLGTSTDSNNFLMFYHNAGTIEAYLKENSNEQFHIQGTIVIGAWNHVLLRFGTADAAHLYINGTEVGNDTSTNVVKSQTYDIHIGKSPYDPRYFDGVVDNIYITDRYFEPEDVDAAWNDGFGILFMNESAGGPPAVTEVPAITLVDPTDESVNNSLSMNFTYNASCTGSCIVQSCSLMINDTEIETDDSITNQSFSYFNNIVLEEQDYAWVVNCTDNNSNSSYATANYTLKIDTTNPSIIPDDIRYNNKTALFTFSGQINFSDNNLFSFNASVNGSLLNNDTNIDGTTYQYNYSVNVTNYPIDVYNFSVYVCDGHTGLNLKDRWDIDNKGDDIIFKTNNVGFKIASDNFDLFDDITTKKYDDRYSFTYKVGNHRTNYDFIVESDTEIFIPSKKNYNAWLVIPGVGKTGRWIDFNLKNVEKAKYKTTRLSKTKVLIEISNIPNHLDELIFESTGELNCNSDDYVWYNRGQLIINATDGVNGSVIDNFDVYKDNVLQGSTTNGTYYLKDLLNQSYVIKVDSTDYASSQSTVQIDETNETTEFFIYTTNSINITFKDEVDNSLADDVNISAEFISPTYNYTYYTTNATLYVDNLGVTTYTIRYKALNGSYGSRYRNYVFTLTNDTHNTLDLYLVSEPDKNISVVVYDQTTLNKVEDVVIYMQRRFSSDNVYRTVSIYETDLAGTAYFEADTDEFYKFLAYYPLGTLKYTSQKLYLESDTYNIYIDLTEDIGDKFFEESSISYNLNYLSASKEFQVSYTDTSAVATNFCLYLKKYEQYGKSVLNSSCSSSSSGTLTVGGMNENITYYGVFTATIDEEERTIASAWHDFVEDVLFTGDGKFGLFMTAVIIIIFSFLTVLHIVAMLLGIGALMFAKLLGLITISWGRLIVLFVVGLIIAIIIQTMKER